MKLLLILMLQHCASKDTNSSSETTDVIDYFDPFAESNSTKNETVEYLRSSDEERLLAKQDGHVMPQAGDEQLVIVNVSMHISRIHSISEADMTIGVDMFLQEEWYDQRLAINNYTQTKGVEVPISIKSQEVMWKPSTYFIGLVEDRSSNGLSSVSCTVNSEGRVTYNRRLSVVLVFPMNIQLYPFDTQGAQMILSAYSETTSLVVFNWKSTNPIIIEQTNLPEFRITGLTTFGRTLTYGSGEFSAVGICLTLQRSAGYCLVQIGLPAAAIVLLSWCLLWIEREMSFNDLIAIVLSLLVLQFSYNAVMPKVSYVKLMDVYLMLCLFCIFVSVMKLALIRAMKIRKQERKEHAERVKQLEEVLEVENTATNYAYNPRDHSWSPQLDRKVTIKLDDLPADLISVCGSADFKEEEENGEGVTEVVMDVKEKAEQSREAVQKDRMLMRRVTWFYFATQAAMPVFFLLCCILLAIYASSGKEAVCKN